MKFSIATVLSLLAVSVSASPVEKRIYEKVTVALSNDQTGAYAGVTFHADGADKSIPHLFDGTSVGADGYFLASSAQLTAFPQNIYCVLKNNGAVIATFTAQQTYADLDGNPEVAIPVNLNGGVINCHA